MRYLLINIIVIALIFFMSCAHAGIIKPDKHLLTESNGFNPSKGDKELVVKMVKEWLDLRDKGNYKKADEYRDDSLKRLLPYSKWVVDIDEFKLISGDVVSRSIEAVHWYYDPPNVEPGVYVVVETYGKFGNIDKYRETVTLLKSGKNKFQVIRSEVDFLDKETERSLKEARVNRIGPRFPSPKITEQEWYQYYWEISALSGWKMKNVANQVVINNLGDRAIYVFTTPAHPAHPAAVKRYVVETNGSISLGMEGYFAGIQGEFDIWWNQFKELNEKVTQEMRLKVNEGDETTTQ